MPCSAWPNSWNIVVASVQDTSTGAPAAPLTKLELFDTMTVYAAPLFHTGDERYEWINRIQAVAKGRFESPSTLVYEMFELR